MLDFELPYPIPDSSDTDTDTDTDEDDTDRATDDEPVPVVTATDEPVPLTATDEPVPPTDVAVTATDAPVLTATVVAVTATDAPSTGLSSFDTSFDTNITTTDDSTTDDSTTDDSTTDDTATDDTTTETDGSPTEEPTIISSSFDDSSDDSTTEEEEDEDCSSISEIVCSLQSFSMLCSLLEETALLDDLDDGLWTVFAPTNEAFNKAPPIPDDLTNVLLGHTISNELVMYEDLVCTQKIEMTNSKLTRTVCGSGTTSGKTYQNGRGNDDNQRPEIIDYNSIACNGIIHVVSEVILP
jgi:uncharacterized surface protein with fasciclin (FAS1) repeats